MKRRVTVIRFSVCAYVCVFHQISGQLATLGLLMSYQYIWNYTRIKIKDRLFLKPFCYKVMTVFANYDCHFTTFWRLLGTWKNNSSCLKAIAVESQLYIKSNWNGGCYNIELAISSLPWQLIFELHLVHFMHVIEAMKLFLLNFYLLIHVLVQMVGLQCKSTSMYKL